MCVNFVVHNMYKKSANNLAVSNFYINTHNPYII